MRRTRVNGKVDWQNAPDISIRIAHLVSSLHMSWIVNDRVYCFRSKNSKARAYARIWGLNRIWQLALGQGPAYIIEVLSEKYDKLSDHKKDEILLHELAHIPKNFSGSLLPHIKKRGKRNFHDRVDQLVALYNELKME